MFSDGFGNNKRLAKKIHIGGLLEITSIRL
jgi:hypothetical protein